MRVSVPVQATRSGRGGSPETRRTVMESQPALNLIPTIQQAIGNLLTTHEPEFLAFGSRLFMALATIVLAWQGIRLMFSSDAMNDKLFDFAKALLVVSFGYGLITFYETPLPGIGVSFSNLITSQAYYFQSAPEARAYNTIYQHFDKLSYPSLQPDACSCLANLIYWTVLNRKSTRLNPIQLS